MGKRPTHSKKKENYNLPAGKGDNPRNNLSEQFRENYDEIDWGHKDPEEDKDNKGETEES
ncbi:hypothetical protein CL634_03170 [bacterium]|nr:hypothetical protein [bacterium]